MGERTRDKAAGRRHEKNQLREVGNAKESASILGPDLWAASNGPKSENKKRPSADSCSNEFRHYFRVRRLNEAAGAADASRATLRESCRTKGSCIAIFAFA